MSAEALVTVFVPVYNAEKYIGPCIDSVLAQTYENWELLLIDDGSCDASEEKIRAYKDRRIRFYQNDRNRGIPYTRNRGLELARGKYIAFLDADDVSYPRRLERSVSFLRNHPEYRVMGGGVDYLIDGEVKKGSRQLTRIVCRDYDCVYCSPLVNSTAMVDMDLVREQCIRYNPEYFMAEDYDFFCQCLQYTSIARIQKKLSCYRTGHNSITARSRKENKERKNVIIAQVREKAIAHLKLELTKEDRKRFLFLLEEEKVLLESEYRELSEILEKVENGLPDTEREKWSIAAQKLLTNIIIRSKILKNNRIDLWRTTPVFRGRYRWIALARMLV